MDEKENFFEIPSKFIGRFFSSEEMLPSYRSEFMRDRDRVMYCTAFRRLAGKTQIYTIGADDHKRNRLTHTLEVAQISRTIAKALGLDCDLAEAIALGHDIGHTPFGHAGERTLHKIMTPYESEVYVTGSPFERNVIGLIDSAQYTIPSTKIVLSKENVFGFKHNVQSVRVATLLEDSYCEENGNNIGLNLTNYTLWGIQNHSKEAYSKEEEKYTPDYKKQYDNYLTIKSTEAEAWSLEGYIAKTADDIAQWHHDLEDALRGGALQLYRICEIIQDILSKRLTAPDQQILEHYKTCKDDLRTDRACIAKLSHIVVNTLIENVVSTSKQHLRKIEIQLKKKNDDEIIEKFYSAYESLDLWVDEKMISKDEVISFSNDISPKRFEDEIRKSVHHSLAVQRMNVKGEYIIKKLFEAYYKHPQQLPDGPILHLMIDLGKYTTIEAARKDGIGVVRSRFEEDAKELSPIQKVLLMRRICDHIGCMTDHYAIEEYNKLYG